VLAEAVLMGMLGAGIGVASGALLEWYTVTVMLTDEAGFVFPVKFPWGAVGLVAGLAVLLATLAGLGPALHAMHLRITEAIAYE
jgi:ABC-type antimicrobial peptide transport system permease subunit